MVKQILFESGKYSYQTIQHSRMRRHVRQAGWIASYDDRSGPSILTWAFHAFFLQLPRALELRKRSYSDAANMTGTTVHRKALAMLDQAAAAMGRELKPLERAVLEWVKAVLHG
jgi:hypothetical protein